MKGRDPLDALKGHYQDRSALSSAGLEAEAVFKAKGERNRRRISAASGFVVGVAAAVFLLTWSARPLPANAAGAAMIERAQMISAGLVQRDNHDWRTR